MTDLNGLKTWPVSASALQAYMDCPLRFYLRYILGLRWPAPADGNIRALEARFERGRQFHRLVQQRIVGVPRPVLDEEAVRLDLEEWWHSFVHHDPTLALLDSVLMPEITLTAPIGDGYRLLARYDLLSWDGDRIRIMDWKTNTRRPAKARIQALTQSYVYRLVAASAASNVVSAPVAPEQVEMIYWFTAAPHDPEVLRYTSKLHERSVERFANLLVELDTAAVKDFYPTTDEKTCRYCRYVKYCQRSADRDPTDEPFDDVEEGLDGLDLDFDQIAEIVF